MEKTPQQAVHALLHASNKAVLEQVRERNRLQLEMLSEMEEGIRPLPDIGVRPLLLTEVKRQMVDCTMYEAAAQSEEVRQMCKESADCAAQIHSRLTALFAKEAGRAKVAN